MDVCPAVSATPGTYESQGSGALRAMEPEAAWRVLSPREAPRVQGLRPVSGLTSAVTGLRKPPALRPGDLVGVVSPSSPGAAVYPHRRERGRAALERLGLRVRFARNALRSEGYLAGTVEERVADLHEMFFDSQVRAIITAIGGNHCNQLLSNLDYERIVSHPKILLGYSDVTVLQLALYTRCHLVSFYGPTLLTGLAEYPEVFSYTERHLRLVLFDPSPLGSLEPAPEWTDEFLDWRTESDLQRPRQRKASKGWRWLRQGRGSGPLLGGCLSSLMHLRGTPYWPRFEGAILFWELSEERPSPADVDAMLMDLELSGALHALSGMVVGRPYGYPADDLPLLDDVILRRTSRWRFPILMDVDLGHTDPVVTLPIGVHATLDSASALLRVDEAGCSPP